MSSFILTKAATAAAKPVATGADVVGIKENQKQLSDPCKFLCTIFPRIPRSVFRITEIWIRRFYAIDQKNTPLLHYVYQQVGLWLLEVQHKIQLQNFSHLFLEELLMSLWEMVPFTSDKNLETGYEYAKIFKSVMVILTEFAAQVALLNNLEPIDFQRIGNHVLKQFRDFDHRRWIPDTAICPSVNDFHEDRMIGSGGFGAVFKANYKPDDLTCVMKIVPLKNFSFLRHSVIDRVIASVTEHPLIVSYFCCFETSHLAIAVTEYVRGVDLENVVNLNRTLQPSLSRIIFAQITAAVLHLHYHGFIYRDLKPSNVMILSDGKAKLIDFDTSKIGRAHLPARRVTSFFRRTQWEFDDGEKAGTPPFMAPEIIDQRAYGRAADWWSAGIVLFKMHSGCLPFRADDEIEIKNQILNRPVTFPKLSRGTKMNKDEAVWKESNMLTAMIYALLEKDAAKRLGTNSYEALLIHPFLAQVQDWDGLASNDPCITKAFEQRAKQNEKGDFSIICSRKLNKNNMLQLNSLKDKPSSAPPLSTYVSLFMRKLRQGTVTAASWKAPQSALLKVFDPSPCGFKIPEADELADQLEKLEVIVPKNSGLASITSVGVKFGTTHSESGDTYFFVKRLSGIAAKSGLVLGDVILNVNGKPMVNQTRLQLETRLIFSRELVCFTVMTSSPYRLCRTRRDMSVAANLYPSKTVHIPAFEGGVLSRILEANGGKLVEVQPCDFYNERTNSFVKLSCIWSVNGSLVKDVYFGDFLIQINDKQISAMSVNEVNRLLNDPTQWKQCTVIPISCLRKERPIFDRLHNIYLHPTGSQSSEKTDCSTVQPNPETRPIHALSGNVSIDSFDFAVEEKSAVRSSVDSVPCSKS